MLKPIQRLISTGRITPTEVVVLLSIESKLDVNSVKISLLDIVIISKLSKPTVSRCLKSLVAKKILGVTHNYASNGGREGNTYTVLI